MSGLKALKVRINSVKSTRKITKAMQMVAAAKLRKAQEEALSSKPYSEALEKIIMNLSGSVGDLDEVLPLFSGTGKEDHVLLIVMTADRGLCGAFNSSILKYAKKVIQEYQKQGKKLSFIAVGKRASEALKRDYKDNIVHSFALSDIKKVDFAFAEMISSLVTDLLKDNKFDICEVVSSQFRSVLSQVPDKHRIIPIGIKQDSAEKLPYEIEPNSEILLRNILPKNLTVQIYTALLQNIAGEHAARMTAMDNATRNAGDMMDRLTLEYNRSRQATITRELIEIISGAEALG